MKTFQLIGPGTVLRGGGLWTEDQRHFFREVDIIRERPRAENGDVSFYGVGELHDDTRMVVIVRASMDGESVIDAVEDQR